jgi:hypothetical protein
MFTQMFADASQAPLDQLTSFGVAGLMGAMWLWERRTSQKREQQIDDAHARILGDRVQLDVLMAVVRQNAEAITRLSATQDQLLRQLERNPS